MRGFRVGAMLATATAAMAAAMLPGLGGGQDIARFNAPPPPDRVHRRRRRAEPTYGGGRCRSTPPKGVHGERERARRRRQIAAGSLTESNGLVR